MPAQLESSGIYAFAPMSGAQRTSKRVVTIVHLQRIVVTHQAPCSAVGRATAHGGLGEGERESVSLVGAEAQALLQLILVLEQELVALEAVGRLAQGRNQFRTVGRQLSAAF